MFWKILHYLPHLNPQGIGKKSHHFNTCASFPFIAIFKVIQEFLILTLEVLFLQILIQACTKKLIDKRINLHLTLAKFISELSD